MSVIYIPFLIDVRYELIGCNYYIKKDLLKYA